MYSYSRYSVFNINMDMESIESSIHQIEKRLAALKSKRWKGTYHNQEKKKYFWLRRS